MHVVFLVLPPPRRAPPRPALPPLRGGLGSALVPVGGRGRGVRAAAPEATPGGFPGPLPVATLEKTMPWFGEVMGRLLSKTLLELAAECR